MSTPLRTRENMIALGVIAAVILFSYLTVVIVPYAFMDDYTQIATRNRDVSAWEQGARSGRPVAGALKQLMLTAIDSISSVRILRLVAIAGSILLAWLLYLRLRMSEVRIFYAVIFATLPLLMLPFQVYAAWGILFVAPFAGLLGGLASLLASAAATSPRPRNVVLALAAMAILLVALLTYQPTAMFFWVFLAMELFVPRVSLIGNRGRIAGFHLVAALGAACVALGIFRVLTSIYGPSSVGRSGLTGDPLGKLAWFTEHVLFQADNLLVLTGPHLWFALLTGALVLVGIFASLERPLSMRSAIMAAVAILLVPLSYAPNLVVEESWSAFRTQGALKALIGLYAVLGVTAIWRLAARRFRLSSFRAVPVVFCGLVLLVASISAFRNVTLLFAEPQITELRALQSQLRAIPASRLGDLMFIQPQWWQGTTDIVVYDEFGLPSTAQPWVPEPMIYLLLKDEERLPPELTVSLVGPDAVPESPTRAVIDMRVLQQFR